MFFEGRMFIWESASGRLVRAIEADNHIVNCVAPHPSLPMVATRFVRKTTRVETLEGGGKGQMLGVLYRFWRRERRGKRVRGNVRSFRASTVWNLGMTIFLCFPG